MSPEKIKHLNAICTDRGVIAALAMDQRNSLKKAIAKARNVQQEYVSSQELEEFKEAVVEVLSPYTSAVLLDSEYGLKAAEKRASGCGLLLCLEQSGYDSVELGRMPLLLPSVTVRKLKKLGANAVKFLLLYNPFESLPVNTKKQDLVKQIGKECEEEDMLFLLEFVGYDVGDRKDEKEYARLRPMIVIKSMEEFSQDKYAVDVLKVEFPVDLQFVKGAESLKGESVYSKEEAMGYYRKAYRVAQKPFVYLSGGVSLQQFLEGLRLAKEAGIPFNGILAGRAIWSEGVHVFAREGTKALREWLLTQGTKNIKSVTAQLKYAHPWGT